MTLTPRKIVEEKNSDKKLTSSKIKNVRSYISEMGGEIRSEKKKKSTFEEKEEEFNRISKIFNKHANRMDAKLKFDTVKELNN
eukprot:CAMPEP_0116913536 /NCGR_PEP_ID=MMETSP0467-20121206/16762_1 /TAXON_ID=283647 /ORGANISM="Mesodinium pulex, Strain SPMC105" /LENGTH=82 /DNA_ID=CAMNT_0004589769 /DNA_START=465 /DNA_END=713 /DNA_ORIENTATION=-